MMAKYPSDCSLVVPSDCSLVVPSDCSLVVRIPRCGGRGDLGLNPNSHIYFFKLQTIPSTLIKLALELQLDSSLRVPSSRIPLMGSNPSSHIFF